MVHNADDKRVPRYLLELRGCRQAAGSPWGQCPRCRLARRPTTRECCTPGPQKKRRNRAVRLKGRLGTGKQSGIRHKTCTLILILIWHTTEHKRRHLNYFNTETQRKTIRLQMLKVNSGAGNPGERGPVHKEPCATLLMDTFGVLASRVFIKKWGKR